MGDRSEHPITTQKGASVLTVILAVIGVFAPFVASLQAAQLFAIIAVLVILWLYIEELRAAIAKRAGFAALALPSVAIMIIAGVAVSASRLVENRSPPPPAITARDVTDAVNSALKHNQPELPPQPTPKAPSDSYRIVVQDPVPPQPPLPRASDPRVTLQPSSSSVLQDAMRQVARARVIGDAQVSCTVKNQKVANALLELVNSAAETENAYYYGKNDKLIIGRYARWVGDVEKLFANNHSDLPDIIVVRMASQGEGQRTFLGIHESGFHAWADMDAKRKVLDAIYKDVANRSCEPAADAALAKCVSEKTC